MAGGTVAAYHFFLRQRFAQLELNDGYFDGKPFALIAFYCVTPRWRRILHNFWLTLKCKSSNIIVSLSNSWANDVVLIDIPDLC